MTRALVIAGACLCAMAAGSRDADAQALGYAVVGPAGVIGPSGVSDLAGHAGAGGELLIGNRVGVGGEYGLFAGSGGGTWIASVNAVVHFAPAERQRGTRPFLTAGYTRMSGEGVANGWNVGGGVDIWARERVGVRVELRDHIQPDNRGALHYWGLRAGIVVR